MLLELVISLYMISLKIPENQNSEATANTSEAGTWMKLLISVCIVKNAGIKFIGAFQ